MKKSIAILFICFSLFNCSDKHAKNQAYYFYNAKEIFNKSETLNDSSHYEHYEICIKIPTDSLVISGGYKIYGLAHYYKLPNYSDTSFVRPKSYIQSIKYFDQAWLSERKNLDSFWKYSNQRFDSILIYIVEPKEGSDSLIFKRVHRYLYSFDE